MNPGLAQGFVKFSSVGYHVLTCLHAHGPCTAADIKRDATHAEAVQISATLMRLLKHRFIRVAGRDRRPGQRSHVMYDLDRPVNTNLWAPKMTPAEKQKGYRERKKLKVASVFAFRGRVSL